MSISSLVLKKYNISSERSKSVITNVINSFFLKGLSIVISLIQVPLTIKSLNSEQYGVWMTLFSITTFFTMFDFGLGNGFRNKFTEAITLKQWDEAKRYNSNLYASVTLIAFLLMVVFLLIWPYLDFYKILNVQYGRIADLNSTSFVIFLLFLLQFVLKNIITVFLAIHKAAVGNLINVLSNLCSLIVVFVLVKTNNATFKNVALGFMATPVAIYFICSMYAYNTILEKFKPTLFYIKKSTLQEISKSGLQFFVIQIAVMVLFVSGNILISHLFSPKEVTPYNISNKLFTSSQFLFTILMTPFWAAFTESYLQKDYVWIKKSIKKIVFIWFVYSLIMFVVLLFSNQIYMLWVGKEVVVGFEFSVQMFVFSVLINWTSIFSYFVNSLGKIKLQMLIGILQAIINIPLAICFVNYFKMGPWSIMFSVNILLLIPALILPIQYYKIINRVDYGLWSK